jgi:hypothetical protein
MACPFSGKIFFAGQTRCPFKIDLAIQERLAMLAGWSEPLFYQLA